MIAALVTTGALVLWLFGVPRWFGFARPSPWRAGVTVAAALTGFAIAVAVYGAAGYLLSRMGAPFLLGERADMALVMIVLPAFLFLSLWVSMRHLLGDRAAGEHPTWAQSAGLSAVTTAVVMGLGLAQLTLLEAA